jgi:hypothetical protein
LRDNGAITDGATGFCIGDEVVALQKFDQSKTYVMAHKDGVQDCGGTVVGFDGENFVFYNDYTGFYIKGGEFNYGYAPTSEGLRNITCDTRLITFSSIYSPVLGSPYGSEEESIYAYICYDYKGNYITGKIFLKTEYVIHLSFWDLVHARIVGCEFIGPERYHDVTSTMTDLETGETVPLGGVRFTMTATEVVPDNYYWVGDRARAVIVSSKGIAVLVAHYGESNDYYNNYWRPTSYSTYFFNHAMGFLGATIAYPTGMAMDMDHYLRAFFYRCDLRTNIGYCVTIDGYQNPAAPYDIWGTVNVSRDASAESTYPTEFYQFGLPRGGGQYSWFKGIGITGKYLLVEHWQTTGGIPTGAPVTQAYDLDNGGAVAYTFGGGGPGVPFSTARACVIQARRAVLRSSTGLLRY